MSQNVPVIVEHIEKLIESGHAYEVDGDVYFRVASFTDYGKLSGRWVPPPEDERRPRPSEERGRGRGGRDDGRRRGVGGRGARGGAGVEARRRSRSRRRGRASRRRARAAGPGRPAVRARRSRTRRRRIPATSRSGRRRKEGEDTSWNSPWGRGRPGWHIECSAMAENILGETFEIHGGGIDLLFPHHENELAQSRALGHDFAPIWAHNGLVRFTGEKMSKSEGNVVTIREALDKWGREARAALLPLGPLAQAGRLLGRDDGAGAGARRDVPQRVHAAARAKRKLQLWDDFADALEDDFDTPRALAVMHDWASNGQHEQPDRGARDLRAQVALGAGAGARRDRRARRRAAGGARARRTSRRPTACAPRSRPRAGRCATASAATCSRRKP